MSRLQKIFWFSLVIKLILGAIVPLTTDEAYYIAWSHRMQWSYFDHGAGVSVLFWLAHPFEHILSLARWPGMLLAHGTIYLWLKVLRPWLTDRQLELWFWLALLSPLLGGSGFIITPDVPMMFFWALALYIFFRWCQRPTIQKSLFLGLSLGLGFCSKYVIVLFPLCVLPAVILAPSFRRSFFKRLPWIVVGGAAGMFPVLIWNVLNDFQSIRFQLSHGVGAKVWKPNWTTEYIAVQLLVIFPTILYLAFRGAKQAAPLWKYMAFVPLIFFLITSYRGYVEANWPIVAYPALFYLAVLGSQGREYLLRITATFWVLIFFGVFVAATRPELFPLEKTKLREFFQFDALVPATLQYSPLYTRSYQMAAALEYKQRRPVYKLPGMNRRDFYDIRAEFVPKGNLFYVLAEKGDRLPEIYRSQGYEIAGQEPIDAVYEVWRVEKK